MTHNIDYYIYTSSSIFMLNSKHEELTLCLLLMSTMNTTLKYVKCLTSKLFDSELKIVTSCILIHFIFRHH